MRLCLTRHVLGARGVFCMGPRGYFQDPFLAPFVDPVVPSPLVLAAPGPPQRAVDVNRGTAIRVAGVDAAVAAFRRAAAALPESASRPPQILALGAGFDTPRPPSAACGTLRWTTRRWRRPSGAASSATAGRRRGRRSPQPCAASPRRQAATT